MIRRAARFPAQNSSACSMRGNVKRKYFSIELKCAEVWSRHSAPSRAVAVRDDDMPWDLFRSPQADQAHFSPWSSNIVADHREAVGGCWFRLSAFPLDGNVFGRTARSGQGRAARRGEANPLPRGPFCDHGGRGKAESRFRTILKRRASQTDARVATIVLSEARGL